MLPVMRSARRRWLADPALWIGLGSAAALVVVTALFWPVGPDYYYTHRPVAERFLRGETRLFDGNSVGFYNAPWSLLLIIPLTWLPLAWGQAALTVASLLGIALALHAAREEIPVPMLFALLAVANLHTFDLLIRGNVDAFTAAGVGMGWMALRRRNPWLLSLGFWLMSIKSVNLILAGALFLFAMRRWHRMEWAKASSLLAVSFLASLFIFGFDWPVRYASNYRAGPPYAFLLVTVWRAATVLHVPMMLVILTCGVAAAAWTYAVWRLGLAPLTLGLALATNLAVTPYALGSHYILLIPAFLYVARRSRLLALLAYAATWTPLLRLRFGFGITWVDLGYPLLLLASLWLIGWRAVAAGPPPEACPLAGAMTP
jgi:hypothetical protein